jgi:hypothetical protein
MENHRGTSLPTESYKLYSKILNEKLKVQAQHFLLESQNGFQKDRSCIDPLFIMKLLVEKRRGVSLETHLAFLDYVKAFDKVKRDKWFEILRNKNIPRLLLKV